MKEQQGQLKQIKEGSKGNPITIEEVRTGRSRDTSIRYRKGGARGTQPKMQGGAKSGQRKLQCKCFGKDHLLGERWPAKAATCYKCNRKGHFSSQCFSKTVAASAEELSLDTAFLRVLNSGKISPWTVTLKLQGMNTHFKMDTGAEVTAISERIFHSLKGVTLTKLNKILHGPTRQPMKVLGQFTGTLSSKDKRVSEPVYVIQGLRTNLLGLPAITALKLVSRINATSSTEEQDWLAQYPSLFKGLGNLGDEYSIKIREGAQPHALFTPRKVPILMRAKVREELDRMERAGVISKVTEPTPLCAGMVVVPKQSGAVRVCVDLKGLNENVLRETPPLPGVDDTLAQLTGATVFSKVDANSGSWQIPLSEDSRLLTTFITPYGRCCFNKLHFGISSAPKLFQNRMNSILEGLEGNLCHMDDMLIYGADKAEHDSRLKAVLESLQMAGVTLNSKKCEFNKRRI